LIGLNRHQDEVAILTLVLDLQTFLGDVAVTGTVAHGLLRGSAASLFLDLF